MITVTCVDITCGVDFGIPEHIERHARRDPRRRVVCPNGHGFVYTEAVEIGLRRTIEQHEKTIESLRASFNRQEESIARILKTVSYWRGIAHRKPRRARP